MGRDWNRIWGDEEVSELIGDLMVSRVLKRVLCSPRAELGEFDALVLGFFLMAQFRGQVIVEDLGFYGRDAHVSLMRENRLIAGVNFLDELPDKLRKAVLLIEDKVGMSATVDDAETLARYAGHRP